MDSGSRILLAGIVLLLIGLSLLVGWALSAPAHADPGIRYAAPTASGLGNCSSWADACTLQTALSVASSGDEIWVKEGVHKPTTTNPFDRTASFTLKSGVAIYGGFNGTETSRDRRNWQTNVTTLSGDIGISGNPYDNSYHVISTFGVASSAILDGFVVTAGNADGSAGTQMLGGGMYNTNNSRPTLRNLIFSGNHAKMGGGMYNMNSHPALENVTFSDNTAVAGGGMYNTDSRPMLTDVTFRDNTADERGGGMYNTNNSVPVLTKVTFRNNIAVEGGGMYNTNSYPRLTEVTFRDNSAYSGGGMYNNDYSSARLTNVIFRGNSATLGGGMYNNRHSDPNLVNILFFSNTANHGGGMFNDDNSRPFLTNATFGGNSASQEGGGMYNNNHSDPMLFNVVMWSNTTKPGDTTPNLHNVTSKPHIAYSDIGGCIILGIIWNTDCGMNGGNNIDANPLFVNLAGGDLRLRPTSPCIDKGNNAALPSSVTTDLDGNPRISHGVVDMGAYEVLHLYLPVIRKEASG